VDPGISGTGVALFKATSLVKVYNLYPLFPRADWPSKAQSITQQVGQSLVFYDIAKVYIEWPSQFSGMKGLAAANSNDILKLCALIGRLSELFLSWGSEVILVPVQMWKGQLPKDVVAERVHAYFKRNDFKSHAVDAAGIGKFILQTGENNATPQQIADR
jgi:hypothetical protein